MKFFLDENFPKVAAEYLTGFGHEVFDIRSTDMEGTDDITIFKLSQSKSAIFLTTDLDFFHTIPFQFAIHHGVVVIAIKQPNRHSIIEKLKWLIDKSGITEYNNKIILLRDESYVIR